MPDLQDGESTEVQGSAKQPYVLTNTGGVYSCTCPAWRHQSLPIEQRSCKHLRKLRGEQAEADRTGNAQPPRRAARAGGGQAAAKDSAPPLLLAHRWENDRDLTGWWLSEKLDGVRAYWDGQQFVSRLGNVYLAPDWFTDGLPDHPLDGELWAGRQMFQKTVSVVRRGDKSDHWKQIKYLVFDAPDHGGLFEDRLEHVRQTVASLKHAEAVLHEACQGLEHLQRELERVEGLGGEGLMVRKPASKYEAGRSTTLLKVKTFFDAEAEVIGHNPGRGRHKGRVGSLQVVTADGVKFSVGTGLSDAQRRDPPPLGAVITFRYQELTDAGVPRFPSFVGERVDAVVDRKGKQKASAKKKQAPAKKKQAPAKKKKAPAKTAAGSGKARRFELVDGKSAKFWEVSLAGDSHTVCYGRIGSDGQTKTKSFADAAAAQADVERLIAQKQKKGYQET